MGKFEIEKYKTYHPFMMKTFNQQGCMLVKITEKNFGFDLYSKPKYEEGEQINDKQNKQKNKKNKKQSKQSMKDILKQNQAEQEIQEQLNDKNNEVEQGEIKKENDKQIQEQSENTQNEQENNIQQQEQDDIQSEQYKLQRLKHFELKRYFLFSKYDEGCQLDEESWFSLIPEPVSEYIASKIKCPLLIDGFCGAGGLGIQLAKTCDKVIANDLDKNKVNMAKNNAKIYSVNDKMVFKNIDFLQFEENMECDCVVACPPWGGVGYFKSVFDLETGITPDISLILEKCLQLSHNVILQLPKNIDLRQLISLLWSAIIKTEAEMTTLRVEVELMKINGNPNQIIIYFGNFTSIHPNQEYQMLYNLLEMTDKEEQKQLREKLQDGQATEIYELLAQNIEFEQDYYYNQVEEANKRKRQREKEIEQNLQQKEWEYNGEIYSSKQEMEKAKRQHQQEKKRDKRKKQKIKRIQKKTQKILEEKQEQESIQKWMEELESEYQKTNPRKTMLDDGEDQEKQNTQSQNNDEQQQEISDNNEHIENNKNQILLNEQNEDKEQGEI